MTRPVKRSFTIKGHRTSISVEAEFWDALQQAAAGRQESLAGLIAAIDAERGEDAGLSSAVRVWVLDYFRQRAATLAPGGKGDPA
jgi:predicted DNA-binding ribbon-helix-helix protein